MKNEPKFDERGYPILYRDREDGPTDPCPHCGKRHTHGQGDGHRVAHCLNAKSKGYIVRTRK